ncbi:MAG: 23S rRNA (adenine(2030)-N(6))-methyltransferase RlmJ [Candidatus Accumulibacter sp.]|jgi:23S rRNA (adenine2030-N6)-methyltransferase|nr:23S rRNA (adenine(2030)-N(6))-methyltransferase RlmJ [Accumulibacter sp.]
MLSYRHAFHAGNHADALKHITLVQLARYLAQKAKPFWYIDTHAGAGRYALDSGYALRKMEHANGIGRLWHRADLPPIVADYVSLVRNANPGGQLRIYPGAALFALSVLRDVDRLRLFELHGNEVRLLRGNLKTAGRRAIIEASDGFSGLTALLPPPPRRALVLIDPPYEEKQDYERVVQTMKKALARFPGGVYAIWYPWLARLDAQELPSRLKRLAVGNWLHAGLRIGAAPKDGFGLYGSGVFIFNPPWTLYGVLSETLPWLAGVLAAGPDASFTLESGTPESLPPVSPGTGISRKTWKHKNIPESLR